MEFTKGEAVIFLEHYDLFDVDMKDKEVMFYKYTSEDKCLVRCPDTGEWAEPKISFLKQKKAGHIPKEYAKICETIKEMVITY